MFSQKKVFSTAIAKIPQGHRTVKTAHCAGTELGPDKKKTVLLYKNFCFEFGHCPDVHPCLFAEDANAKLSDFVDNQHRGIITS